MTELIVLEKLFEVGGEHLLHQLLERQRQKAREVLLRRMTEGRIWAVADDKGAAAIFAYLRAAQEGAARANLDLLAQIMAGKESEGSFAPDEFRRWARVISELTRDELVVLAQVLKAKKKADTRVGAEESQNVADITVEDLSGPGKHFKTEAETRGCLTALLRTGFLEPVTYFGTMGYEPTPNLLTLARLASFEEALDLEDD